MSAAYCQAKVPGAQGGFCREIAVPGSDYCEAHEYHAESTAAKQQESDCRCVAGHHTCGLPNPEEELILALARAEAAEHDLAMERSFSNAAWIDPAAVRELREAFEAWAEKHLIFFDSDTRLAEAVGAVVGVRYLIGGDDGES